MKNNFFIRVEGKYQRVIFNEILYLEGRRNYIKIVTQREFYMVLLTMLRMEELLPASHFLRIHKSYIVSLDKVQAFDSKTVSLENIELPLGDKYKQKLEKAVLIASNTPGILVKIPGRYERKETMVS